jgi:phosphomannomutase/phosphoglucomutase
MTSTVDASLFKAYDIRGVVDRTLTTDAVRAIGAALGAEAIALGRQEIVVGRDGRLSGPKLRDALVEGIRSTGTGVVDVGMVATPMLYLSTHLLGTGCGVEITGSHNPPDYNGLKMVLGGATLYGEAARRCTARRSRSCGRSPSRVRRRAPPRPARCARPTCAMPTSSASPPTSSWRGR